MRVAPAIREADRATILQWLDDPQRQEQRCLYVNPAVLPMTPAELHSPTTTYLSHIHITREAWTIHSDAVSHRWQWKAVRTDTNEVVAIGRPRLRVRTVEGIKDVRL